MLGGEQTPALLVTGSHGMEFPLDDPRQLPHQGALLCHDWPGHAAWGGRPIPEEFYLAGDHLAAGADLRGMIAFFFACYGAGTPQLDDFSRQAFKERMPIASQPFVADLPRKMLSHPRGALAVIGHIDRAWTFSYDWPGAVRSEPSSRARSSACWMGIRLGPRWSISTGAGPSWRQF